MFKVISERKESKGGYNILMIVDFIFYVELVFCFVLFEYFFFKFLVKL